MSLNTVPAGQKSTAGFSMHATKSELDRHKKQRKEQQVNQLGKKAKTVVNHEYTSSGRKKEIGVTKNNTPPDIVTQVDQLLKETEERQQAALRVERRKAKEKIANERDHVEMNVIVQAQQERRKEQEMVEALKRGDVRIGASNATAARKNRPDPSAANATKGISGGALTARLPPLEYVDKERCEGVTTAKAFKKARMENQVESSLYPSPPKISKKEHGPTVTKTSPMMLQHGNHHAISTQLGPQGGVGSSSSAAATHSSPLPEFMSFSKRLKEESEIGAARSGHLRGPETMIPRELHVVNHQPLVTTTDPTSLGGAEFDVESSLFKLKMFPRNPEDLKDGAAFRAEVNGIAAAIDHIRRQMNQAEERIQRQERAAEGEEEDPKRKTLSQQDYDDDEERNENREEPTAVNLDGSWSTSAAVLKKIMNSSAPTSPKRGVAGTEASSSSFAVELMNSVKQGDLEGEARIRAFRNQLDALQRLVGKDLSTIQLGLNECSRVLFAAFRPLSFLLMGLCDLVEVTHTSVSKLHEESYHQIHMLDRNRRDLLKQTEAMAAEIAELKEERYHREALLQEQMPRQRILARLKEEQDRFRENQNSNMKALTHNTEFISRILEAPSRAITYNYDAQRRDGTWDRERVKHPVEKIDVAVDCSDLWFELRGGPTMQDAFDFSGALRQEREKQRLSISSQNLSFQGMPTGAEASLKKMDRSQSLIASPFFAKFYQNHTGSGGDLNKPSTRDGSRPTTAQLSEHLPLEQTLKSDDGLESGDEKRHDSKRRKKKNVGKENREVERVSFLEHSGVVDSSLSKSPGASTVVGSPVVISSVTKGDPLSTAQEEDTTTISASELVVAPSSSWRSSSGRGKKKKKGGGFSLIMEGIQTDPPPELIETSMETDPKMSKAPTSSIGTMTLVQTGGGGTQVLPEDNIASTTTEFNNAMSVNPTSSSRSQVDRLLLAGRTGKVSPAPGLTTTTIESQSPQSLTPATDSLNIINGATQALSSITPVPGGFLFSGGTDHRVALSHLDKLPRDLEEFVEPTATVRDITWLNSTIAEIWIYNQLAMAVTAHRQESSSASSKKDSIGDASSKESVRGESLEEDPALWITPASLRRNFIKYFKQKFGFNAGSWTADFIASCQNWAVSPRVSAFIQFAGLQAACNTTTNKGYTTGKFIITTYSDAFLFVMDMSNTGPLAKRAATKKKFHEGSLALPLSEIDEVIRFAMNLEEHHISVDEKRRRDDRQKLGTQGLGYEAAQAAKRSEVDWNGPAAVQRQTDRVIDHTVSACEGDTIEVDVLFAQMIERIRFPTAS